jgi:drug/metabolite transporter (DMT)-like permease
MSAVVQALHAECVALRHPLQQQHEEDAGGAADAGAARAPPAPFVQRIGAMRLVGLASSVASVCCALQFLWMRPMSALWVPTEVFWLSLVNATVCTVVPLVLIMMAIERIGAALTSQAGMIGPMATIALGVWLLDEPFNAWTGMGTLLVLGGVYMVSKLGDR